MASRKKKSAADFFHYPPVDSQQMAWGAYLTGGGRLRVRPQSVYPPAGHPSLYQFAWARGRVLPEFTLLYIKSGRGQFESTPTGPMPIKSGQCFMLFPGVWHRYRPLAATGWTELWITLSGKLMHGLMDAGMIRPDRPVFLPADDGGFELRFEELLTALQNRPAKTLLGLGIKGLALVAEAAEGVCVSTLPRSSELPQNNADDATATDRAVEVIWTTSHRSLSVQAVADAVGVGRRTLERQFHAERGRSVHAEIVYCRLNRARRLLEETDLPIKSVAYLSGFADGERLRTSLRAADRTTPHGYRTRGAI